MLIMIDGIDGSGKSTIINAWKSYLSSQSNTIFDLKKYLKDSGYFPDLSEPMGYDFIFSAEPTYAGVGAVIREELIKHGTDYPVEAVAEAYSLDRLILYTKILIPLLADDRCIIQDRGISTSLAYQSLARPDFTMEKIAFLVGNQLALKHRPDHLIIVDTDIKNALERLNARAKKDESIFEKTAFMEKAAHQFSHPDFQKIFKSRGTTIHYLNGNEKIDIMKQQAIALLKQILT